MTANEGEAQRGAAAVFGFAFALFAPLAYALQHAYELARFGRSNPRLLLSTLHVTYYWRVAIAVWAGVAVALAVSALAQRADRTTEPRVVRALAWLALVSVPSLVLAAFLFP